MTTAAKANGSAPAADEPLIRLGHLPKRLLAVRPPGKSLRLLVVDSRPLHALAATLLESPSNAVSVTSAKAETFCAKELAFDIILLEVSDSTLDAMVLAAHLRAIERQKPHPRRAAIIACTVRSAQYLDCLGAGSGLSGALNLPWTPDTVHACLARWRDGKRLPALVDRAARTNWRRARLWARAFDINIFPDGSWVQSRLNSLEPVFNWIELSLRAVATLDLRSWTDSVVATRYHFESRRIDPAGGSSDGGYGVDGLRPYTASFGGSRRSYSSLTTR